MMAQRGAGGGCGRRGCSAVVDQQCTARSAASIRRRGHPSDATWRASRARARGTEHACSARCALWRRPQPRTKRGSVAMVRRRADSFCPPLLGELRSGDKFDEDRSSPPFHRACRCFRRSLRDLAEEEQRTSARTSASGFGVRRSAFGVRHRRRRRRSASTSASASASASAFGVRCSVFGVRCSVFGVRCSVFRVPCSVFRVPCSVFRVPCSVFGVRRSAFGIRHAARPHPGDRPAAATRHRQQPTGRSRRVHRHRAQPTCIASHEPNCQAEFRPRTPQRSTSVSGFTCSGSAPEQDRKTLPGSSKAVGAVNNCAPRPLARHAQLFKHRRAITRTSAPPTDAVVTARDCPRMRRRPQATPFPGDLPRLQIIHDEDIINRHLINNLLDAFCSTRHSPSAIGTQTCTTTRPHAICA